MSTEAGDTFRVLYVEDAFDQALLVKAFFKAAPGFVVTHAQDGDQALRLIDQKEWDLIVTDLNLPGTDGFSIIRHAKATRPDVPILVTTGYTQAQYEEQALRAGADQVMIKPLTHNEFISRIWAMMEKADEEEVPAVDTVLAVEGRLGDAEMGCGGTLMRAVEKGANVVIVPLLATSEDASNEELKAASIAARVLGVDFRVDRTLFGNAAAQRDLLDRTINELRPAVVYLPAPDDRDASRREASEMGRAATFETGTVLGYETATTGLDFSPSHFVDVRTQMVIKLEALATYQSLGAPRVDLRPRMAQAYARYWGRFRDFTEVEAFEEVKGG